MMSAMADTVSYKYVLTAELELYTMCGEARWLFGLRI